MEESWSFISWKKLLLKSLISTPSLNESIDLLNNDLLPNSTALENNEAIDDFGAYTDNFILSERKYEIALLETTLPKDEICCIKIAIVGLL